MGDRSSGTMPRLATVVVFVLAALSAKLSLVTAAAPYWWEQGGTSIRGIWPKCALGEGLSTLGQMRGLPAFMRMLDRLQASNVSTLQMVVYDSGDGYDPGNLWCGLAGNNYSKPLTNIGTEADWHTFIDAAHAMNITVTSFWNAAYFWTGSPYFKQAEADIRQHGLDALPATSPAHWFRWSTHRARHVKPADDKPNTNWCSDWVWDPDVNASYFSVWGCQPTTDFASEHWRDELTRILTRWIVDLKLDGFMFDAPDGYIGAGNDGVDHTKYNPQLIRDSISGVIRNVSGSRAAAFAEIYSDVALMDDFGFDGEFADDKICPQHSGKYCKQNPRAAAIGQGIFMANASLIESAMIGPGSVDDLSAQLFRAPGLAFRSSYIKDLPVSVSWLPGTNISNDFGSSSLNCSLGAGATYAVDLEQPVPLDQCFSRCADDPKCEAISVDWFQIPKNWTELNIGCGLRGPIDVTKCTVQAPVGQGAHTVQYSAFAVDAPIRSQMVVAVPALAGYLPVVRNSGNDWTSSAAAWPGDTAGELPKLLSAMRRQAAFDLKSLRSPIATTSGAHYSMMRYDALGTGQVALVAINLGASGTVELALGGLPPQLLGQKASSLMCKECPPLVALTNRTLVALGGYSYDALVGLQLPQWVPQGFLANCSAVYAPLPVGTMSLTECLITCLHDAKCDAVMVDWVQPHAWPRPSQMVWYGNEVQCHVRGDIDLTKCDKDTTETHSVITMTTE